MEWYHLNVRVRQQKKHERVGHPPMATPCSQLISHWKSLNLKIAPGNLQQKVREFESQNGVILPSDFREYFLCVDGMAQVGGHDCDPKGFAFWPLARVRDVVKECAEHSLALPEPPDPNRYFVFADYLQWSWAYAIHLGDSSLQENQIIHVGTVRPKIVANSFARFVDQYLRDAERLYADAA
jgi:hypothetical protein